MAHSRGPAGQLNARWRPWLGNLARLLLSAGLLAWLIAGSDGRQLWDILRRADLSLYLACSLISTGGMLLRALRWKAVLDAAGARVSFRRACALAISRATAVRRGESGQAAR